MKKREKLEVNAFRAELSRKLSILIGFRLGVDSIYCINEDGSGWRYYIQGLKPGYPVLAMHYDGPTLILALPLADWRRLETGETTVDDYIARSHWNYGYLWGGGGLISGAYWQPLEFVGIHDTTRISRYLRSLYCRTYDRSTESLPGEENCSQCRLDETTCPFSNISHPDSHHGEITEIAEVAKITDVAEFAEVTKNADVTEFTEDDARIKLVEAINERLEDEHDLKVYGVMPHSEGRDELILHPCSYDSDAVEIRLDRDLLNDLLYHPDSERDYAAIAGELNIQHDPLPSCEAAVIADSPSSTTGLAGTLTSLRVALSQRFARFFATAS